MKAIIYFHNDPTVGWFSETYEMTLPEPSTLEEMGWMREDLRKQISELYFAINGENSSCKVRFSDEMDNDI